ncbi:myb/SANT-like DNA-binding domain-containing protein 1 [Montipora foliosa]|uniref:myb/SANT-like DNA-binding domain-containing protein 1 n=1 Tax=Montipora foliosa TaxID=591990 RepID=UPI0035F10446
MVYATIVENKMAHITAYITIEQSIDDMSQPGSSRNRCPNWSDAETRFLLQLWRDSFPISKRRNGAAWDSIAKKLNGVLNEQGISTFRTGTQCKAQMKSLQDEYKRVKDHNSRSGNNRETFDYFDEIDAVLGCKPNIAPKRVFECGFSEDASSSSVETGDSADPPQSSDQGDQSSDVEFEKEFEKNLQGNSKPSKKANKGKTSVTTKKRKALPSERSESNLVDFLEKSQSKDHEFFERLAEKEAERELKSQKLMFDCVKEIAKIFKGDN